MCWKLNEHDLKQNTIYLGVIYEPHGTIKQKTTKLSYKREGYPCITLKTFIKSQGKRARGEMKKQRTIKTRKQTFGNMYVLNSYMKCKWVKCSNKKTEGY